MQKVPQKETPFSCSAAKCSTPTRLGEECWIAARSFVGPGVEVGDAAVASGEREMIVAGNPAKFVGKRGRDALADRSS